MNVEEIRNSERGQGDRESRSRVAARRLLIVACMCLFVSARASSQTIVRSLGNVPEGKGVTLEFEVEIQDPLPAGVTMLTNQATVTGNNFAARVSDDPDTPASGDPTLTLVMASPDLTVSKSCAASVAQPGDMLVYTIVYANVGNQDATGVFLADMVPTNTTFYQAASSPGWTLSDGDPGGSVGLLPLGDLAGGSTGSVQFAVLVDDPVQDAAESVVNMADIADDGANGGDTNTTNNTAIVVTPLFPSLWVTIASSTNENEVVLGFPAEVGFSYWMESSTDLVENVWFTNFTDLVTGVSTMMHVNVTNAVESKRFFRAGTKRTPGE